MNRLRLLPIKLVAAALGFATLTATAATAATPAHADSATSRPTRTPASVKLTWLPAPRSPRRVNDTITRYAQLRVTNCAAGAVCPLHGVISFALLRNGHPATHVPGWGNWARWDCTWTTSCTVAVGGAPGHSSYPGTHVPVSGYLAGVREMFLPAGGRYSVRATFTPTDTVQAAATTATSSAVTVLGYVTARPDRVVARPGQRFVVVHPLANDINAGPDSDVWSGGPSAVVDIDRGRAVDLWLKHPLRAGHRRTVRIPYWHEYSGNVSQSVITIVFRGPKAHRR